VSRERTFEPAPAAEPSFERDTPLKVLLTGDPADAATLVEKLQRLPADEQAARWVDQLLDDPRIEACPAVREQAVRTLLAFGHPWALLINPEDLERFRKLRRDDIRPARLTAGAALGVIGAIVAPYFFELEINGAAFAILSIFWALSVALRSVMRFALTRLGVMLEVVLGLILAVTTLQAGEEVGAVAMLAAVVPVALAGLAGAWKDP
jgi:hypothetical protein